MPWFESPALPYVLAALLVPFFATLMVKLSAAILRVVLTWPQALVYGLMIAVISWLFYFSAAALPTAISRPIFELVTVSIKICVGGFYLSKTAKRKEGDAITFKTGCGISALSYVFGFATEVVYKINFSPA